MASLRDKLLAKCVPEPNSGCWLWEGCLSNPSRPKVAARYGVMRINKRLRLAHRVSYALFNGALPDDLVVRHTCDNTYCVNPEHLLGGTQRDNVEDRERRGRGNQPKGMGKPNAKLTDDDVLEIRRLRLTGMSAIRIAAVMGIKIPTVENVVFHGAWSHVK